MNAPMLDEPKVEQTVFTQQELSLVESGKVPRHVAIIMDGNRRWARQRFMPALLGHWRGVDAIIKIVKAAAALEIKVLTLFAFSTENWTRSEKEVNEIMKVLAVSLQKQCQFMIDEGVRLNTIGDLSRLPSHLVDILAETKNATSGGKKIDLVLALNYGGKDDIRRAFVSMAKDLELHKIRKEEITEDLISRYLDTAPWGDPDLFIRTSGEHRISNFLLWQLSYSEVYLTKTLWPDFNEKHLLQAVIEFQQRERRFGGA